jgi:GGDEF domain-containing protein
VEEQLAMHPATVVQLKSTAESRARALELSAELRAAAADGDEVRIKRLLSDLLRFRGLPRAQRTTLQLRTLQNLVYALRAAVVHDELTGLLNRHGFLQSCTRLLDVALRNRQPHHLVYFQLRPPQQVADAALQLIPVRNLANLMRDVFPSYGVYEALGRLSATEFAALTPCAEYAFRDSILLRGRRPDRSSALPGVPVSIGIAHFDPLRPVPIDELLEKAERAMHASQRVNGTAVNGTASSGLAPQSGVTHR